MPVARKEDASSNQPRTSSSRVQRIRDGGPVRVWSECGVTVCVDEQTRQFIRFTTGHERIAPDDKPATIRRVEQAIYEECETIVNKRVTMLSRLVRAAATGSTSGRSKPGTS